jgi:hypothetical protein
MKTTSNKPALVKAGVLLAFSLFLELNASAGPKSITLCGSISNTAYLPNGIEHESRKFEVTISNSACFYMITNPATGSHIRAAFSGGELTLNYRGPWTNRSGAVLYPSSFRTERRQVPRADGTWLQYLWFAFGCHSYFTNRSDASALPVWVTDPKMNDKDEARMGTRAFYKALPGSPFPSEVNYVSDGCDYFIGHTAGILQKLPLPPPLNAGYTNFVGRTTAQTNIQGLLLPVRFEVDRYGPKRQPPDTRAALTSLAHTTVAVEGVALAP